MGKLRPREGSSPTALEKPEVEQKFAASRSGSLPRATESQRRLSDRGTCGITQPPPHLTSLQSAFKEITEKRGCTKQQALEGWKTGNVTTALSFWLIRRCRPSTCCPIAMVPRPRQPHGHTGGLQGLGVGARNNCPLIFQRISILQQAARRKVLNTWLSPPFRQPPAVLNLPFKGASLTPVDVLLFPNLCPPRPVFPSPLAAPSNLVS